MVSWAAKLGLSGDLVPDHQDGERIGVAKLWGGAPV